jgi:hypothetical protein
MANTAKSNAERMFAESDRKAKLALNEREKAREKSRAHTASLRALRLAKEAADKEAAEAAAAAKPAARKKPSAKKAPAKKARVY